jgi:hypothetical protein
MHLRRRSSANSLPVAPLAAHALAACLAAPCKVLSSLEVGTHTFFQCMRTFFPRQLHRPRLFAAGSKRGGKIYVAITHFSLPI